MISIHSLCVDQLTGSPITTTLIAAAARKIANTIHRKKNTIHRKENTIHRKRNTRMNTITRLLSATTMEHTDSSE